MLKKIYEGIFNIFNKSSVYFIKHVVFLVIVGRLLVEDDAVFLYSSITYLMGVIFDTFIISKRKNANASNRYYVMEILIMLVSIISVICMICLKISDIVIFPCVRMIMNIVLIIVSPYSLIEGVINSLEKDG